MITFSIEGKDFEKLEKFQKKHKNCIEKYPNMTGAQYSYSFINDSMGTLKSCKCVCGKSITMDSDYNMSLDDNTECRLRVVPDDTKTTEIVRILKSMQVRPSLYFGGFHSYRTLRAFLFGYSEGVRTQGDECYWESDMLNEVDEELGKMTDGKKYTDEEMFTKFFEAFASVLKRDYPQFIME